MMGGVTECTERSEGREGTRKGRHSGVTECTERSEGTRKEGRA
jgi:hypothetical protein